MVKLDRRKEVSALKPFTLLVHYKKHPYDVYIGRPSKWGNPFVIGKDGTREEVIEKYRQWIMTQPGLLTAIEELRGKILGCWCYPKPCHGEVLIEILNQHRPKEGKSVSDLREKLKERIFRAISRSREVQEEIRSLGAYPPLPEEVDHAERFIEALIMELERIGRHVQAAAALYPECRDGRHDGCPGLAQASYCCCLCHEPKIMEN